MGEILSVGELTRRIKRALERGFSRVEVEGEVSRFVAHRSGHWYFVLKDDDAVLSCAMFRNANQRVGFTPRDGERLVLVGDVSVYPPRGNYQLIVRAMRRAGAGDIAARLEALKRKLQAEGLFDPRRKRPLPPVPRAVGVATSPTGAAIRDILKVMRRRFPGAVVYLAPCRVQGEGAAEEIVDALRLLAEHGKSEVIIVGRGGGSQEDLFCFNDERVARAIAASPVPVVSAVGHEIDTTIADLVADRRAATPSHAAELVVPERERMLQDLDALDDRMKAAMARILRRHRERVGRLVLRGPHRRLQDARRRCDELGRRRDLAMRRALEGRRSRLAGARGRLDALSPLSVLGRGYAVVLREGRAVIDAAELAPGDGVELRLHRGGASARVEAVRRGGG